MVNLHIKNILIKLFLLSIVAFIASCGSTPKMAYKIKVDNSNLRFYTSEHPKYKKGEGPLYAFIDSNNVMIHYSFQPGNIYKTYQRAYNYVCTLVQKTKTQRKGWVVKFGSPCWT